MTEVSRSVGTLRQKENCTNIASLDHSGFFTEKFCQFDKVENLTYSISKAIGTESSLNGKLVLRTKCPELPVKVSSSSE